MGVTGFMNPLMAALTASGPEIVSLLLKNGANPTRVDVNGSDPLMFAAVVGNSQNAKFWLSRFPNWNLERRNTLVGGVVLGVALYSKCDLEMVKLLLDHGASVDFQTDSGGTCLTNICSCEDANPEVLQLLFDRMSQRQLKRLVLYRIRGRTLKWRTINRIARFLVRNKITHSGLMHSLARSRGSTALHYAVRRGDLDITNLLLRYGADPSIKNVQGFSSVDYCDAFPELRGGLKRIIHIQKDNSQATLRRRDSTASDMKFPMYLIPLKQLQSIYGGKDPRVGRIEAHQELKKRNELVRWEDLPIDAHIIFMSHEWVGWNHPDPHGIQLKTFLRIMKRLISEKIEQVEMNRTFKCVLFVALSLSLSLSLVVTFVVRSLTHTHTHITSVHHVLLYKENYVVCSSEWKDTLSKAYV